MSPTTPPLKLALVGFDEKSANLFRVFLGYAYKDKALVTGEAEAEAVLLDMDARQSAELYASLRKRHPDRLLILLSLHEDKRQPETLFVKKPTKAQDMLATLDEARKRLEWQRAHPNANRVSQPAREADVKIVQARETSGPALRDVLATRPEEARAVLPRRASHWVGGLALALAAAFAVTAWVWRTPATSEAPMTPPVAEVAPIPVETSPPPEPMPAVTEAAPEPPAPQPPVSEPAPSSPEPVLQNPAESPAAPAPPPPAVTAPLAASSGDAQPEAQPTAAQPTPVVETPAAQPAAPSPPPPPQEKTDKELEKESRTTPPGADLLTPSLGVGLPPALQASKFAPGELVHAKRPQGAGQSLPRTQSGGQPGVKISRPVGVSGPDWLLEQDSTDWSLQIMSVSDLASIAALRKRYPELKDLSTYRAVHKGKTLHPVLYGLFSSEEEATQAAAQLPESLGKPIPRRLGDIQREVGAGMQGGMVDYE
jgi:septal ring-binding cell division protein DamX